MLSSVMDITIKGYCSLKDVSLSLKPGVTVLTGASNVGKSSLIKAVSQTLYNPTGSTFINNELGKTKITVVYNNHNVTFTRDVKSSVGYTIDGVKLDKVVGQPSLIEDIGFSKGGLVTSDVLNFWEQMGLPFLIHSTPKDRYEILSNGVSGLEEIRELIQADLKSINIELVKETALLDNLNLDVDRLKALVLPLEKRSLLENTLASVSSIFNTYKVLHQKLTQVSTLVSTVETLSSEINKMSFLTSANEQFSLLETKVNALKDLNEGINTYKVLYTDVVSLEEKVSKIEEERKVLVEQLHNINVCPLCGTVGIDLTGGEFHEH